MVVHIISNVYVLE